MKYAYKDYQKGYPIIAEEEMARLRKLFPEDLVEHFGSTAIPGVGGKGIIDLYLAVKKQVIPEARRKIENSGYDFKPSGGVPKERWFYQKDKLMEKDKWQRFHLHLTYWGNTNLIECLNFRDYLRNHPDKAGEYSKVKHRAAEEAGKYKKKEDKKRVYMEAKRPVIEKIMEIVRNGKGWKVPPRIKVYEALGCMADGRVKEITETGARVVSSEGNKIYTVIYDEKTRTIGANDNGSYWQGYLGYPAIAYLMIQKKLSYDEGLAQSLKGISWKKINTKYKNDFAKTEAEIYGKVDELELETLAGKVLREIGKGEWQKPVKRRSPPAD